MESYELVLGDMRSLAETCRQMERFFRKFGKNKDSAAALIDEVGIQLSDLSDEWERKYRYITAHGFDEEGDYSYAKLGYSVSLAYKKYSEILNRFRFGLDRLKLLDEYFRFEAYYEIH